MKLTEELKQLRSKSNRQLLNDLSSNYQKLRKLKFAIKFKKLKNIKEVKQIRTRIARIWTLLGEKA